MEIMTRKQFINDFLNNFEYKQRQEGVGYYSLKEDNEEQKQIVWDCHQGAMPNDWVYSIIYFTLDLLKWCEEGEMLEDYFTQGDLVDCYTYNLTEWLHDNNNRLEYLTKAMEEYSIKDGFQALQMAQDLAIQEIGHILINAINEAVEG